MVAVPLSGDVARAEIVTLGSLEVMSTDWPAGVVAKSSGTARLPPPDPAGALTTTFAVAGVDASKLSDASITWPP